MANTNETTLVSLFHTKDRASKALNDLEDAGIPKQSIQVLSGEASPGSAPEQSLATLQGFKLPKQDLQVLSDGLKSGGTVIIVRADDRFVDEAETIFERYRADQIDEREINTNAKAATTAAGEGVIPVIEEELVVGKRTVERGGVRVFSRVVETPVEEQVVLREEHAKVERRPVNRPISEAELNSLQDRSIEVREMAEEPVVGKTSRVVEEVSIRKDATEREEKIKDTVRRTQVEADEIGPDDVKGSQRKANPS